MKHTQMVLTTLDFQKWAPRAPAIEVGHLALLNMECPREPKCRIEICEICGRWWTRTCGPKGRNERCPCGE